ncbi:MAG: polysaccharide deacetylase family protein [Pseudomonadota bacterium]
MSTPDNIIWPAGKRAAAIISVIFDDGMDAVARAPDLANRNKSHSVWLYGANRGVERLCRTFKETNIRTSWFVPGLVAEKHRTLVRDVATATHDVESHGWGFERHDETSRPSSLELLRRSRQAIEAVTGKQVTGFRLPIGNWPDQFDLTLREAGFLWSASLNGDDVPYMHPSSLVEIPVHLELEDRPYFQFNFTPAFPKGQSRIASYDSVLSNWIAEFDAYRKFGACFVLQLRPEMTGTPGRIFLVEALIKHIQSFDDVWIATGAEICAWHLANNPHAIGPDHPLNVFAAYKREHRVLR